MSDDPFDEPVQFVMLQAEKGLQVGAAAGDTVAGRREGYEREREKRLRVPGDVLITGAGGHALVSFGGAAGLAIGSDARAEIRPSEHGEAHVVAHQGAFVASAGVGAIMVETGAGIATVEGGSLAFRYTLHAGLSGTRTTLSPAGSIAISSPSTSRTTPADSAPALPPGSVCGRGTLACKAWGAGSPARAAEDSSTGTEGLATDNKQPMR